LAITTSDFYNGLNIEIDGEIFTIVDFQHVKLGRGSAYVRAKLKNIKTGKVLETTFRAGEKFERANLEERKVQFLYKSGETYHFMDMENYEEISLLEEQVGENRNYLKENLQVTLLNYKGDLIGINLPIFVELKVIETEPGIRGDTVSNVTKPAKLETGLVIQVPLFVEINDVIKIDTRTGEYVERVS
jgi:elongation factor P